MLLSHGVATAGLEPGTVLKLVSQFHGRRMHGEESSEPKSKDRQQCFESAIGQTQRSLDLSQEKFVQETLGT